MERGTQKQDSSPIIWIIGNTVLMDGIAAGLAERQIPNLRRWEGVNAEFNADLQLGGPDLLIFELDTPGSYALLELLKEQPGIHLLGIDRTCSQVIVLNSAQRKTRTMAELYHIVQETAGGE